jgi:toxin ParE1/3/4
MGARVILTPQALADLEAIVRFIAQDRPARAKTFGEELLNRALSAGDFPASGRITPEIGDPVVREIVHGSYRIIYEIFPERGAVFVLRFWHAARGVPEIGRRAEG